MGTNFVRVFGLIERVSVGVGVGVSVGVGVQWCFVCHGLENSTWTLGHLGTWAVPMPLPVAAMECVFYHCLEPMNPGMHVPQYSALDLGHDSLNCKPNSIVPMYTVPSAGSARPPAWIHQQACSCCYRLVHSLCCILKRMLVRTHAGSR